MKSWSLSVGGVIKIIPSLNNTTFLELGDEDYAELKKKSVFASLFKNGDVLVLDEEPVSSANSSERLQVTNDQLLAKNKQLENQLSAMKEQNKKKVAGVSQDQYNALKKEANNTIAEKDKRIAELEKRLGINK